MFFRTAAVLLALLFNAAHAYNLQSTYKFTDHAITSKMLFSKIEKDFIVLNIPANKTRFRVPASTVTREFKKHDIQINSGAVRYITFIKKSPVDLSRLEDAVQNLYIEHYPSIVIKQVTVTPRVYTKALPKTYRLGFGSKSTERSEGTFYIRTEANRKLFFDYTIVAMIGVIHTKHALKRKSELTLINTVTHNIALGTVRGEPLTAIGRHQYRLKQNVKANTPLSKRNVEASPMVKRGKQLLVSMKNGAVLIEFAAIALEDGALHDIIAIRKADGQRIQAKVTGFNKVEIQ